MLAILQNSVFYYTIITFQIFFPTFSDILLFTDAHLCIDLVIHYTISRWKISKFVDIRYQTQENAIPFVLFASISITKQLLVNKLLLKVFRIS